MLEIELSPERRQIRDAVQALCDRFGDDYWREKDAAHAYPVEFQQAVAQAGWLGITMPPQYGGAGLGITEAALVMQVVGNSAGALAACSTIHINIFAPHAIVVHGSEEQKQFMLPPLIRGEHLAAFGVTEPDAGLDTTHISTRAVRQGSGYVISGRKMWMSTAQRANKVMLLARTTPIEQCRKPTDGMSLFYTDLDRRYIEVREIRKMGRAAVDSNAVFIDARRLLPHIPPPIGPSGTVDGSPPQAFLLFTIAGAFANGINRSRRHGGSQFDEP